MGSYNWMSHYKDRLSAVGQGDGFTSYRIQNETGTGEVLEWRVFAGMRLVYNRLEMGRCAQAVPLRKDVLEVSYCSAGGYESAGRNGRCFVIGPGDLSVGSVGRAEAPGWFPTRRYDGFTLFVEKGVLAANEARILDDLKIDLKAIDSLTGSKAQRFVLHRSEEAEPVMQLLASDPHASMTFPLLRLRCLELMSRLSCSNIRERGSYPTFVSSEQARIASLVQKRITADLTKHVTIEQMKRELHAGSTMIKTSFKNVYGMSVYAYLKDCRLREAKRLLLTTDAPVADIALRVGYLNPGKFSVAFKKQYGIQPARIRVQMD